MDSGYDQTIAELFGGFEKSKFKVLRDPKFVFTCGGVVESATSKQKTSRGRLVEYIAASAKYDDIHESIVLAEEFKDYFKENTYRNLQEFEDDIASISSLVLIFLESPGSLVELGMFCTRKEYYKKILVVAPREHVCNEDSFIYLGPLHYIRQHNRDYCLVYDFSDSKTIDDDELEDLCEHIQSRLMKSSAEEIFSKDIPGHLFLLLHEIIRYCYPVLQINIENAATALGVELEPGFLRRGIYVLEKLNLIGKYHYSNADYYYPLNKDRRTFNFGISKGGKIVDYRSSRMKIQQSYMLSDDSQTDRKRRTALKKINEVYEKGGM